MRRIEGRFKMRSEYQEPNQPIPINESSSEIRQVAQQIGDLQGAMERSETEARRIRSRVEQHEHELLSHDRRSKGLLAATIILACALIGATWYELPQLWNNWKQINELTGVKDVLSAAQNKIGSIEAKLTDLRNSGDKLADRMASVEKAAAASLGRARAQSQQLIVQAEQRMHAEMSQAFGAVQEHVATIESAVEKIQTDQETDRTRLASLQADLAKMSQQIASNQTSADQQLSELRQNTNRNYSDLSHRIASDRSDFDYLVNRIGQTRTNFQMPKERIVEVIPELRIRVNHTDVAHQRLDAWIQVVSDGTILWVNKQGIEQPLSFYSHKDARSYDVVFTQITDREIAGFVLTPNPTVPTEPSSVATASTSQPSNN